MSCKEVFNVLECSYYLLFVGGIYVGIQVVCGEKCIFFVGKC